MSYINVYFVYTVGIPGTVPWGVLNVFFIDFLHKQKGYTVEMATLIFTMLSVGNFTGTLLGGIGGQYCYNRDPSRIGYVSSSFFHHLSLR